LVAPITTSNGCLALSAHWLRKNSKRRGGAALLFFSAKEIEDGGALNSFIYELFISGLPCSLDPSLQLSYQLPNYLYNPHPL